MLFAEYFEALSQIIQSLKECIHSHPLVPIQDALKQAQSLQATLQRFDDTLHLRPLKLADYLELHLQIYIGSYHHSNMALLEDIPLDALVLSQVKMGSIYHGLQTRVDQALVQLYLQEILEQVDKLYESLPLVREMAAVFEGPVVGGVCESGQSGVSGMDGDFWSSLHSVVSDLIKLARNELPIGKFLYEAMISLTKQYPKLIVALEGIVTAKKKSSAASVSVAASASVSSSVSLSSRAFASSLDFSNLLMDSIAGVLTLVRQKSLKHLIEDDLFAPLKAMIPSIHSRGRLLNCYRLRSDPFYALMGNTFPKLSCVAKVFDFGRRLRDCPNSLPKNSGKLEHYRAAFEAIAQKKFPKSAFLSCCYQGNPTSPLFSVEMLKIRELCHTLLDMAGPFLLQKGPCTGTQVATKALDVLLNSTAQKRSDVKGPFKSPVKEPSVTMLEITLIPKTIHRLVNPPHCIGIAVVHLADRNEIAFVDSEWGEYAVQDPKVFAEWLEQHFHSKGYDERYETFHVRNIDRPLEFLSTLFSDKALHFSYSHSQSKTTPLSASFAGKPVKAATSPAAPVGLTSASLIAAAPLSVPPFATLKPSRSATEKKNCHIE